MFCIEAQGLGRSFKCFWGLYVAVGRSSKNVGLECLAACLEDLFNPDSAKKKLDATR